MTIPADERENFERVIRARRERGQQLAEILDWLAGRTAGYNPTTGDVIDLLESAYGLRGVEARQALRAHGRWSEAMRADAWGEMMRAEHRARSSSPRGRSLLRRRR